MLQVNMRNALSDIWMQYIMPVNFVHDEIMFECRDDYLDTVLPVVRHQMEHSVQFSVPMRTETAVVKNWGDAK